MGILNIFPYAYCTQGTPPQPSNFYLHKGNQIWFWKTWEIRAGIENSLYSKEAETAYFPALWFLSVSATRHTDMHRACPEWTSMTKVFCFLSFSSLGNLGSARKGSLSPPQCHHVAWLPAGGPDSIVAFLIRLHFLILNKLHLSLAQGGNCWLLSQTNLLD